MLLGVIEGNPLLRVLLGRDELSQEMQGVPQRYVGPQEESGVLYALGQAEELLP